MLVDTLCDAATDLPMDIYFCILDKMQNGYVNEEYNNNPRPNKRAKHELRNAIWTLYSIHKMVDLDGTHVGELIPIRREQILTDDCFMGVDGNELYYEENPCTYEVVQPTLPNIHARRLQSNHFFLTNRASQRQPIPIKSRASSWHHVLLSSISCPNPSMKGARDSTRTSAK